MKKTILFSQPSQPFTGKYFSEELDASYELVLGNGKLIARHRRAGDYPLHSIAKDTFEGESGGWAFGKILFKRDGNQKLTGFFASGKRYRNIWFKKLAN